MLQESLGPESRLGLNCCSDTWAVVIDQEDARCFLVLTDGLQVENDTTRTLADTLVKHGILRYSGTRGPTNSTVWV